MPQREGVVPDSVAQIELDAAGLVAGLRYLDALPVVEYEGGFPVALRREPHEDAERERMIFRSLSGPLVPLLLSILQTALQDRSITAMKARDIARIPSQGTKAADALVRVGLLERRNDPPITWRPTAWAWKRWGA